MPVDPPPRRAVFDLLGQGPDTSPLLTDFARALFRRAPERLFLDVPPQVLADRLRASFEILAHWVGPEPAVHVRREPDDIALLEVVGRDRPFLLATVTAELERTGAQVVRVLHPIVGVVNDAAGRLVGIGSARRTPNRLSILHIEIRGLELDAEERLVSGLRHLLDLLGVVTADRQAMRDRLERVATELRAGPAGQRSPSEDGHELADLLDWLLDDNLVLLGVADAPATELADHPAPSGVGTTLRVPSPELPLGLLRAGPVPVVGPGPWPPIGRGDAPELHVTRTRERSPILRSERMEVFGISRPEAGVDARIRVVGLFTRKARSESVRDMPVVRRRLEAILDREDVVAGSHDAIALTSVLQALPKDEPLRATTSDLHGLLIGLLDAEHHGEVVARVREDPSTASATVVAGLPAERWTPSLGRALGADLARRFDTDAFDLDVALDAQTQTVLRVLLLDVPPQEPSPRRGDGAVTTAIRRLSRSWVDAASDALADQVDADRAERLRERLLPRLPLAYRDRTEPDDAPLDLLLLDAVGPDNPLQVALRATGADDRGDHARLLAAKYGDPLELSSFIPIIESLGLTVVDELPHELHGDGVRLTLHDLGVRAPRIEVATDGPRLTTAVLAAFDGHLELDAMNRLVLGARLHWRDVAILRAYRRLRRQLGTVYTPIYIDTALASHPEVVRALVDHFHARFDPAVAATSKVRAAARDRVIVGLEALQRLDHDRILRGMLELVDATLRTNAFRPDAVADHTGEPYIALKIDPSRIRDVPEPVPHREIFVHSPRVEGVHLRAGPVARGGLRWSDRRDDVRTEVLDLLKAQVLKNAVIIPTGAKGGFVLGREPSDPMQLREEVRRQYVTFVRALLDVTDDLDGELVVPPPGVIRHDGDDPYLVVAADRGTAAFSDTANAVAERYGFWLDDAFASGGSRGYDHKRLGVTARGAWAAVTRHFRALGLDVEKDPITVAGVGDMSGDVFGNGLLRSRAVRLVAAFDHRHVFLDPDPDPDRAFDARAELFARPRSSWADYDGDALGPGAVIGSREARSIELSEQARAMLRLEATELAPPDLIRAILRAPVDLLFAGGVGTYVKASTERHEDLGDRANDELRVDATEVRARVLGEGANLFITQRGRIELARRGTHLNQDAVDNAAGVATSDLEVNIKILLRLARDDGRIDRAERDDLLGRLADDVVAAAIGTVDRQALAITRERVRAPDLAHAYRTWLRALERDAGLDRGAEVLPDDAELRTRQEARAGCTRPEIATMVAWAKRELKESLLDSEVPAPDRNEDVLRGAFPAALVERFPDLLTRHRLARELISTRLANDVVDRMGVTFAHRLAAETSTSLPEVVAAFRIAETSLGADLHWAHLDVLDAVQEPERVRALEAPLEELLLVVTRRLLWDVEPPGRRLTSLTAAGREVLEGWTALGTEAQRRARRNRARRLVDDLVDEDLARLLACVDELALVPDIAAVHAATGEEIRAVADTLLVLGELLGIDRLEGRLRRLTLHDEWARRQRSGLQTDLRRARCRAAMDAHHGPAAVETSRRTDDYLRSRGPALAAASEVLAAAEREEEHVLDALAVAVRGIVDVTRTDGDESRDSREDPPPVGTRAR